MTWRSLAACAGMDTDLFFVEQGRTYHPEAMAACARCPVTAECITDAIACGDLGLRGGLSESERHRVRRNGGRRPLADPVTTRRRESAHQLRGLGWPNERIMGVIDVDRRTVARYMAAACGATGCWCERRATA